jgi:hypothetical protein
MRITIGIKPAAHANYKTSPIRQINSHITLFIAWNGKLRASNTAGTC